MTSRPRPLLLVASALFLALSTQAVAGLQARGPTSSGEARAALARASASFRPDGVRAEASLALRDLALVQRQLAGAERRQAAALLARPSYSVPERVTCSHVCLHWAESGVDAPPLRDVDADGAPDWVETTMAVLDEIWAKEIVEFGFRPPKSDLEIPDHGPDGRLDVYLQDIADEVLGYCAPEVPSGYDNYDLPGYCVLDDDYSLAQLGPPAIGGRTELRLTAAHEFFHAVQFGYDAGEDDWLLEGTATWIEDEVYDALNEPHVRFPYSPLMHPGVPVDMSSRTQPFQYGSWVFWRFLEELFSVAGRPRNPAVIRRVWEHADGRPGAPDLYSLQAVEAALRERGSTLRRAFSSFGVANAIPRTFYREGAAYPSAPPAKTFTLSRLRPTTGRQRLLADHLTNRHVAIRPGQGLRRGARLAITVDLPARERSAAAAIVLPRSGKPAVERIGLDAAGNGSLQVAFGSAAVERVVLVLTNASARFSCWRRTDLACSGEPLDDDQPHVFTARVVD